MGINDLLQIFFLCLGYVTFLVLAALAGYGIAQFFIDIFEK